MNRILLTCSLLAAIISTATSQVSKNVFTKQGNELRGFLPPEPLAITQLYLVPSTPLWQQTD